MSQKGGVSLPEAHGLSTKQRQRTSDGSRPLRPNRETSKQQQNREPLPEALGLPTQQRRRIPRLCSVRRPLRSSAALRPRQIAIPATAPSCSLYRPTSRPSCRLYSLSLSDRDPLRFSRRASSSYISRLVQLLNSHARQRRLFARSSLHSCKGPFPPIVLRFRPWTVFFTTTFTFSYSNVHHEG